MKLNYLLINIINNSRKMNADDIRIKLKEL